MFVTLWAITHQVPLSMGFPRKEYWSGLPFPSPEDLSDPGTEPTSPALVGGFFTTEPHREARLSLSWASLVAQLGQNSRAMWETQVHFLGWEDSLEKGPVTHSSILDWRIHGLYSLWGCKESDMTERLSLHFTSTL